MKVLGGSDSSLLTSFTQGLDVDVKMYAEEIEVQKKWVIELCDSSYITPEESEKLLGGLEEIKYEIEHDQFEWNIEDEDIHMNIERTLTIKLGELGKKVHLGRSRNDLVATTQRKFVHNQINKVQVLLNKCQKAMLTLAENNLDLIIPGMTHLQSGQPVRYAHTVLGHLQALKRDSERLGSASEKCLDHLPLGAAAFSGTHLNLNLDRLAKNLNFKSSLANSYDAVGDRDFILNALNAYSNTAVHLSRLCNEIIYYSSSSVGIIKLPKNWTTGSSIMPNKRNPDTIEITRAKMARVIAAANEANLLVAQVVPSYGSDLHELKRTFVKATQELHDSLEIMVPFVSEMSMNKNAADQLLEKGHILATEFANHTVENNSTGFRDAYLQTKELVEEAEAKGCQVHDLEQWPKHLDFNHSVEARDAKGGTALSSCEYQIKILKDTI